MNLFNSMKLLNTKTEDAMRKNEQIEPFVSLLSKYGIKGVRALLFLQELVEITEQIQRKNKGSL